MLNYSFNVVDEHGNIRGSALIDTKESSKLRFVPTVVAVASTSALQSVESLPTTTGHPPLSSRHKIEQVEVSCDLQLSEASSDSDHAQPPVVPRKSQTGSGAGGSMAVLKTSKEKEPGKENSKNKLALFKAQVLDGFE